MSFSNCFVLFLILSVYVFKSSGFVVNCSNNSWQSYKTAYNKTYSTALEDIQRRRIFCDNLRFIDSHNERFRRGEVTYTMQINRFADWTHDELIHWMHGDSNEVPKR